MLLNIMYLTKIVKLSMRAFPSSNSTLLLFHFHYENIQFLHFTSIITYSIFIYLLILLNLIYFEEYLIQTSSLT